jgi:hypothetical protein
LVPIVCKFLYGAVYVLTQKSELNFLYYKCK